MGCREGELHLERNQAAGCSTQKVERRVDRQDERTSDPAVGRGQHAIFPNGSDRVLTHTTCIRLVGTARGCDNRRRLT